MGVPNQNQRHKWGISSNLKLQRLATRLSLCETRKSLFWPTSLPPSSWRTVIIAIKHHSHSLVYNPAQFLEMAHHGRSHSFDATVVTILLSLPTFNSNALDVWCAICDLRSAMCESVCIPIWPQLPKLPTSPYEGWVRVLLFGHNVNLFSTSYTLSPFFLILASKIPSHAAEMNANRHPLPSNLEHCRQTTIAPPPLYPRHHPFR